MADSGSRPGQDQEPRFFRTLVQDFRRVMADIHRVGLRRSMGRTLTELQAGLTAEIVSARLVAAVEAFVGDAPRHDDLSLVVLKRTLRTDPC